MASHQDFAEESSQLSLIHRVHENHGLYYAASQAKRPKPIPICIKAISDFANKDKSDDHQEYAAYVSATFMKHFVQNVLPFE